MAAGFRTIVGRALRRRCPVCGEGRLFETFTRLKRSCDRCRWVIEREAGAVTGAMYLISIVSQLFAAALFLALWLGTDWSNWQKLAVALPLIALFSYVALPFSRALWVAVDYYTDVAAGDAQGVDYARDAFEKDDA